jgi:hypothetical protein
MKLTAFIAILIFFISCGKKYDCPNELLLPVYKGYAINEIDTVIVKRFQKGSNFSSFIDSVLLAAPFSRKGDTTYISSYNYPAYFDGSTDIQITNPFDNKKTSVSNVNHKTEETRNSVFAMDRQLCVSPVTSFTIDGTTIGNTNEVFVMH